MKSEYLNICELADLISRHILRQTTEEEEKKLADWRVSSIHRELQYKKLTSEEFIPEKISFTKQHNVEEAYEEFLQKLTRSIRRRRLLQTCRYAALALIFLGSGLFFFLSRLPEKEYFPVMATANISPGSFKAIMTLADGEQVHIYDTTYSLYSVHETTCNQPDTLKYRTITIPRGGEYVFTLSDGTRVWLNSESEIRFPLQFGNNHRKITMSGEIFFQVARDTSSPFVIHTGEGDIEVLGTSFNVRNYSNEQFLETTLVSGKVAFLTDRETILAPGEQLRKERATGVTTVSSVNPNLFCSWKDGRFIFEKQHLSDIMSTVARWYNVEVVFEDESLKDLLFTGNIKRYGQLESLLDMMKLVNKVGITISGNKIIISPQEKSK